MEATISADARAEQLAAERPIFLMPGFTWDSELSLGPLQEGLKSVGYDQVHSADYYDARLKPAKPEYSYGLEPKTATERLALRALQAIDEQNLRDKPLTVVAHSYGALIYEQAFRYAEQLGWSSLVPQGEDDSREVIFLAPSGTLEDERLSRIMPRYTVNLGSLAIESNFDDAFWKQQKRLFAEPSKRLREAWRLARDQVDYGALTRSNIHVHVLGYNADRVFPAAEYDQALLAPDSPEFRQAIASYSYVADRNATHSDPLLSAERNAKAIYHILHSD